MCENEVEERNEGGYLPVPYVLCKFPADIQCLLDAKDSALALQPSYRKRIRKAICEDIAKYTL